MKKPPFCGLTVASIFLVVLVAFTLRTMGLTERCLWSDEAVAISYNGGPLLDDLARMVAVDIHPPLPYLVQRFFLGLIDDAPLALRMHSLLFGTAACLAAFLIGLRLFGLSGALFAGLFLALQPAAILQAQTARMYAMGGFAMLLALAAWRRLEEGRPRATLLLAAALALGLHTDYPLALGQFALLLPALLRSPAAHRRRILIACTLAALTLAPLLAMNLASTIGDRPATDKYLTMEVPRAPLSALTDAYREFTVATDLPPLALLLFALLLPLPVALARDRGEARAATAVWCAAVLPPALLFLASEASVAAGGTPLFVPRAVFFVTGPLALWFGFLASRLSGARVRTLALAGLVAALLYQNQIANFHFLDQGWREVSRLLDRYAHAAPRYYAAPWFLEDELRFYRSERVRPIALDPADVGIRNYLDMFRRHAVPRGSVEAWLEREVARDTAVVFILKDLECALGDGVALDHDRAALDWFRENRHLQAHHVVAFPNGRSRRDLFVFGRDPVGPPRERSVTLTIDPSRMPLAGRFVVNPVAEIVADGKPAYRFRAEDFEHGPGGAAAAYAFLEIDSFALATGAVALSPADPLPTVPLLSSLLVRADRAGRALFGTDLLLLGELPPVSGLAPRKVMPIHFVADPSADPLLRLAVFLLASAALLAALSDLALGLVRRAMPCRRIAGGVAP